MRFSTPDAKTVGGTKKKNVGAVGDDPSSLEFVGYLLRQK